MTAGCLLRPTFHHLSDGVRRVIAEKNREESDRVYQLFCDLTGVHVYFELLHLEWKLRLERAWYMGYELPQNFLQVEYLDELPDRLLTLQRQVLDLLTHIWITDTSEKSVEEKMTACYLAAEQAGKEQERRRGVQDLPPGV